MAEVQAIAQKTEPFQAMEYQLERGITLWVQVTPSGEVTARVELLATAQKTDPFQAIARQLALAGRVL